MQKRLIRGIVALCVGTLLVATVGLQGKGPTPPPWPLKMSLANGTEDGVLSDESNCVIQVGEYCSGLQNVRAELLVNSEGNFVFDTNDAPGNDGGRRLILDFGVVTNPLYPFGATTVFEIDTFIGTLGEHLDGNDPSLTTMALDDVVKKRMRINWVNGNLQYNLRWDGSSGRGFVSFMCTLSNGITCSEWTASPATTAKAGLYSIPTKGRATEAYYGEYAMPFSMTLVRQ